MKKKELLIKISVSLVVCVVLYGIFWFFKVGQTEKMLNSFVSENNANISVGNIAVSGFPFSQKVTVTDLKFVIPNPALNKYQVVVKNLEATTGIFGKVFDVKVSQVSVQDSQSNNIGAVEFGNEPTISIAVANSAVSHLAYQDNGYKIVDADKNLVYAASATNVSYSASVADDEKITINMSASVKDMQNFDVINIYKNVFEKSVIEGIRTGEIALSAALAISDQLVQPVTIVDNAVVQQTSVANDVIAPAAVPTAVAPSPVVATDAVVAPTLNPTTPIQADAAKAADTAMKTPDVSPAVARKDLVKSNLALDIEYVLTPVRQGAESESVPDPVQIHDTAVQYTKSIDIRNLEFTNPLYKIAVSGKVKSFEDDSLPSGSVVVKIESISNLVGYVATSINEIVAQQPVNNADMATVDGSGGIVDLTSQAPATSINSSYHDFLKRIATNFAPVIKDLSVKNSLSKDENAAFEVKREKGLNFTVNDIPAREILGKF